MAASGFVAVLAVIPLLPFIFIFVAQLSLRLLGWYLQAHTKARKVAIVDQVKAHQAVANESHASREVEDGWEKVEESGTADNGKPLASDWNGVIGFFHPFWQVAFV